MGEKLYHSTIFTQCNTDKCRENRWYIFLCVCQSNCPRVYSFSMSVCSCVCACVCTRVHVCVLWYQIRVQRTSKKNMLPVWNLRWTLFSLLFPKHLAQKSKVLLIISPSLFQTGIFDIFYNFKASLQSLIKFKETQL